MRNVAIILAFVFLVGCASAPAPTSSEAPAVRTAPAQSSAPDSSTEPPPEGLDERVAELQKKYDENPSDTEAKKELVSALMQDANYYMYKSPLPPKEKYPKALALYRRVLKLEPDHRAASESANTIESIYQSMNRPVPDV